MLQKTLGAEEPGGGVGWDFLWHMERRPLAPRHPHGHVRRAQGRPTASPSTADRVPRRRQGAESSPKSHLANKGAPDKHSNFSCRRQAVTKENTTDTGSLGPEEDPSPTLRPPTATPHLVPSTKMRGWNGKIRGKRSEERELKLGGKLCRTSRVGVGAAALKRGHIDCRRGGDRV